MHCIAVRLEAWRSAERRRDAQPPGSPEWLAADEDVRRALAEYQGEASQVRTNYAELEFAEHEDAFAWQESNDHVAVPGR